MEQSETSVTIINATEDYLKSQVAEKEMPKEPEKDFVTMHQHSYNEQKQEIENAIRILSMTDEETVNTSTYNAVARYL